MQLVMVGCKKWYCCKFDKSQMTSTSFRRGKNKLMVDLLLKWGNAVYILVAWVYLDFPCGDLKVVLTI